MAIGAGWGDGDWVDAGWVVGAWQQSAAAPAPAVEEGGGDDTPFRRKKRRKRQVPTSEEVFREEIRKLRQPEEEPEVLQEPTLLPTALPLEEIKDKVEQEIAFLIREDVLKKQQEVAEVVAKAVQLEKLGQQRIEAERLEAEGKRLAQEAIAARIQEEEDARRKRNNALIYLMIMALSDD